MMLTPATASVAAPGGGSARTDVEMVVLKVGTVTVNPLELIAIVWPLDHKHEKDTTTEVAVALATNRR